MVEALCMSRDPEPFQIICAQHQSLSLPAAVAEIFGNVGKLIVFALPGMDPFLPAVRQKREDAFLRRPVHALSSSRARHSSSLRSVTPSSAARRAFEPASAPAITRSVLPDTEPVTRAPRASARALASLRLMLSSRPVKTSVFPAIGEASSATGAG